MTLILIDKLCFQDLDAGYHGGPRHGAESMFSAWDEIEAWGSKYGDDKGSEDDIETEYDDGIRIGPAALFRLLLT